MSDLCVLSLHGSNLRPLDRPNEEGKVRVGQVDCTIPRQYSNKGNPQNAHSADNLYNGLPRVREVGQSFSQRYKCFAYQALPCTPHILM